MTIDTEKWREVSKEEFFAYIYSLKGDVMPHIINDDYPYTSHWREVRDAQREVLAISEGYIPEGEALERKRWWLPKK